MPTLNVTDLYQAAYLLTNGCEVEEVQCIPAGGAIACRLTFSGEELDTLSERFLQRSAEVNLFAFRQAYNQIHSYVHQAKKSYRTDKRGGMR